jgi:Rhodanese-related sulfurtransferase
MKSSCRLVSLLICGLLTCVAPAFGEDEGLGEWVSQAAPKKGAEVIPPGQFATLAKYADLFLSTAPGGSRTIYAETLMDGVDDPNQADELGDFFLVDVRPSNEYCADTVPGAINIPMNDLAKAENLAKLPTDKPILLICNTGHTASISTAVLGVLGYDVWTLRFGMMGWRASTKAKLWSPKYSQIVNGAGYPVQKCQ